MYNAIVIGTGPAGLTAATELWDRNSWANMRKQAERFGFVQVGSTASIYPFVHLS
ncbi:thioredoxin reductase [Paenibacillus sp. V4I7]|nr:thioredoxin reductase [Paenibacillus sp. V4I7]MDQ0920545.1 thioredoxin reductase [Paenibacillus sp. V4I5]